MAHPRPRYDGYAKPLPHLVEGQRRTPSEHDLNTQHQHLIEALLAEVYDALLIPGIHAEVHLGFTIHDGVISREIYIDRRQQHRLSEQESRHAPR